MLNRVKCPICSGPVNRVWFVQLDHMNNTAEFVAECWSGDIHHEHVSHIFPIKVKFKAEVVHADAFVTITETLQNQLEEYNINAEVELQKIVDLKKTTKHT